MKKITSVLMLALFSLSFLSFQVNAAEGDETTNVEEKAPIEFVADTEINPEDSYEEVGDGYTFRKDSVLGLKVEEADEDVKDALGIEPDDSTYILVTVAARALAEDQTIDSIDSKVDVDSDVFSVENIDGGDNGEIIAGDAFPNIESSFYDAENNQMNFKASSDTPIPFGEVTDVFSYLLKVKKENTKEISSIVLEGLSDENQGAIIVSSTGDDIGTNLFTGKVGIEIKNIPAEVAEIVEPVAEPVAEPAPEPTVEPEEIVTGSSQGFLSLMIFLFVGVATVISMRKKRV